MVRAIVRGASVALTLAFILSCQLIVTGDVPAVNCSGTSPDACPKGKYCKGAGCVACEQQDVCDGYDNDCNGTVDDGELSDKDKDGFTWCGQTGPQDCDDGDSNVRPNADEVCNGKDDNCNGAVDESCTGNTRCAVKLKQCVVPQCDPVSNMPCTQMGSVCDPGTLECVKPASKNIGEGCKSDAECIAGAFCAGADVLGVGAPTGSVCTRTCCRSDQCPTMPTSTVCYGSGRGNFCVAASVLGRTAGGSPAGASANAGSQCRSGLVANGKCMDVCCAGSDCMMGGTACIVTNVDGHQTLGCGAPASSDCGTCTDGTCVGYGGIFGTTWSCRPSCCGSGSCPGLTIFPTVCWNEPFGPDFAPLCTEPYSSVGAKGVGEACTQAADCRSRRCFNSSYCTDVCCMDRDCPAGFQCRPVIQGNAPLLRCLKKQ